MRIPKHVDPTLVDDIIDTLEHPDPHWADQASCKGMPVAVFYPEREDNAASVKRVCATCPVRIDCLATALLNNEKHGLWGGHSTRTRSAVHRAVSARRPDLVDSHRNTPPPSTDMHHLPVNRNAPFYPLVELIDSLHGDLARLGVHTRGTPNPSRRGAA